MKSDMQRIRARTCEIALRAGYAVNEHLPLLDVEATAHSADAVSRRGTALQMLFARLYGFDRKRLLGWLDANEAKSWLTPDELAYVSRRHILPRFGFRAKSLAQIEAQWALAWALSLTHDLSHTEVCGDHLAGLFPDFRTDEPFADWSERAKPKLRTIGELLPALDLLYCLHWAIVQSGSERKPAPGSVPAYVVVERRRALEWVLNSNCHWTDVPMDT